jgi:hypothetical protein
MQDNSSDLNLTKHVTIIGEHPTNDAEPKAMEFFSQLTHSIYGSMKSKGLNVDYEIRKMEYANSPYFNLYIKIDDKETLIASRSKLGEIEGGSYFIDGQSKKEIFMDSVYQIIVKTLQ